MSKSMKDIVGGALLLAFGLLLRVIIPIFVETEDDLAALSPDSFPLLIAWAIIVLSLLLLLTGYRGYRREKPRAGEGSRISRSASASIAARLERTGEMWPILLFVIMGLYTYFLTRAGFLLTSAVCAFAMLALFRIKAWYSYLIVLVFIGLVYFVFGYFMKVPLPSMAY